MAQNRARLVVPGRAYLHAAPVGTAAPVDSVVALAATFVELGFTTEDSTEFTYTPDVEKKRAHQSDFPVRTIFKGADAALKSVLEEWSGYNFQRAFGGGTSTEVSPGNYKYSPPSGSLEEIMLILSIKDGGKNYRWVVPSASPENGLTVPLNRTDTADLEVNWGVNGSDSGDPWYLLTDDPAFAPLAP